MKTDGAAEELRPFYLPDFCTSRATLAIVLIVELTALVTTLARGDVAIGFWTDLARTSLFLLWIGLIGAGLLCWSAQAGCMKVNAAQASTMVLAGSMALIAAISAATWALGQHGVRATTRASRPSFRRHMWPFVLRNATMGFIVTALALRYFYVTHQWRRNVEMQAKARVHALQARIRPHFLFNSMNTIASLTRSNPARAESAVQDLADLFRANLSEKRNTITLARRAGGRAASISASSRSGSATGSRSCGTSASCRCRPWCPGCCCSRCWRTRSITASNRGRRAAR